MRYWIRIAILALILGMGFGWSQEEQKEEPVAHATMVVVAEKQEDTVQNVPMSVSVMQDGVLESKSVQSFTDFSFLIPNLFVASFSAKRTAIPYLRGIGAGQGEPAVTTYVDGVPQLSVSSNQFELLDVERVEVLRGPQGSLYGRNTLGGLVHLILKEPGNEFQADLKAEFGEENHQRFNLGLSGPIVKDKLFYRVSGSTFERDGFTTNDLSGEDVDFQDSTFVRLQLLATPNESWRIKLNTYSQDDRDGGFLLSDRTGYQLMPFHVQFDTPGQADRDLSATSLHVTYHATHFDVTSITSFDQNDAFETTDMDFMPLDYLRRQVTEDQDQVYQELRFSSDDDTWMGAKVNWLVGLTYYGSEMTHQAWTEVRPEVTGIPMTSAFLNENYTLDDNGWAMFGHATLALNSKWDLTLGLRWENETKKWDIAHDQVIGGYPVAVTNGQDEADFDDILPKVSLTYHVNPTLNLFGIVSKSYRSGGYNRNTTAGYPYSDELYTYDEETGWSYEAGIKGSWFENRLYASFTAFSLDWENRQLSVPLPGQTGQYYLDNVAESRSQGLELELHAALCRYLDLQVGFGSNAAEFKSYIDPTTGLDVNGNQLPQAPDQNSHLALSYHQQFGDLFVHADTSLARIGQIYYDNANTASQKAVDLIQGRFGISYKGFDVSVWGKNLGDELYFPMAIPHTIIPGSWAVRPGNPREVGVSLS